MEPAKQAGEPKKEEEAPKKNAKQLRMEERARKEAEKKAAKPAAAAAVEADHAPNVDVSKIAANETFGMLPLNQSSSRPGKAYTRVETLTAADAGKTVLVRARLHNSRAKGKKLCFILLRQRVHSVQAVASPESGLPLVEFVQCVSRESLVELEGEVKTVPQPITSTTQQDVEIAVKKFFVVSIAHTLPLQVEDVSRPQPILDEQEREIAEITTQIAEVTAQQAACTSDEQKKKKLAETLEQLADKKEKARKFVNPDQSVRLNYRVIDLRTQANHGIFRIQSMVGQLFREFLLQQHFVEIHSPKIISAASEGGANVFTVKYFDQNAYLAQSPQLYKQMAICADFERVFEIGEVFRAENANTHRHLTEFVGLDLEMAFNEHYHEILEVMDGMFCYIFDGIAARCKAELAAVNAQFPFTPIKYSRPTLRLEFKDGVRMLAEAGVQQDPLEDLNTANERKLGELVKKKYDVDFFILDKFPASARPFYTMLDPTDPNYTNSYDLFIRGEEIVSGSQRIHDHAMLEQRARDKGVTLASVQSYIDAFKFGAPPHGGCGVGLERVVMLYLGLGNIRKSSLFPRDPSRVTP